jgi:hypothetical protein
MIKMWNELGRTVRAALESWARTIRLCVLMLFIAASAALFLTLELHLIPSYLAK